MKKWPFSLASEGLKHAIGQMGQALGELRTKQLEAEEFFLKVQKNWRKLFMLLEGQQLLLQKMDRLLADFIHGHSGRPASALADNDAMELMDLCEKLLAPQPTLNPIYRELLISLQLKIQCLSGLVPIAQLGKMTNTDQFTIVDSWPDQETPKGAVTGIISQGYARADSSALVRSAKVVVSSHSPSP